ncbi:hypothetical protein [Peptostreptococcus porci]|uniref:hypothetical protein n=2 Tax=Bacillota TaxID=1239 RepID=UPI002A919DA9|nr:hypothetical protein [Peptostreptococcus porci]
MALFCWIRWLRHFGIFSKRATTPKTNSDYWMNKFEKNVQNDEKNYALLRNLGWHVIVVWECEIKSDFDRFISSVEDEPKSYQSENNS